MKRGIGRIDRLDHSEPAGAEKREPRPEHGANNRLRPPV